MENKRPTTEEEKEVFSFLNLLRSSGVANMFGATPYIVEEFGIDKANARKLLSLWMENFNDKGDYETVKL